MRIRKIMISALSLMVLCACSTPSSPIEQEYSYILFVTPLREHPIWLQAKEGFIKACEEEGYKCDWRGPTTIDINEMNNVFETGLMQKADAIITQGVVDPALLEEAKKRNIPVILVDSDIPTATRTAYFGKDFNSQARLFLEDIEKKVGKDVKLNIVVQAAQLSFDIAKEQIREIEAVFAKHEGGFEILATTESKSDKVRARKEWNQALSENPQANIAINFAAESAESCYDSAVSLGMQDDVLIYGVDDLEPTLNLIREDKIEGSVITNFYDYGYETVKYIHDYLEQGSQNSNQIYPVKLQLITNQTIHQLAGQRNEE